MGTVVTRAECRQELQSALEGVLGTNHVYYEPPESFKMQYPCIVYVRDNMNVRYADNEIHNFKTRYQVTYIDRDPDSEVIDNIMMSFANLSYGRHYVSDNLHHDVFYLYY